VRSNPRTLPSCWPGSFSGQRICILTFGCTYNEGDSSRLHAILSRAGSVLVDDAGEAEVVVLNTCVVIEKTERRMVRLLRELTGSGKEVIVTGCLPAARPDLLQEFETVRVLFPEEIHALSEGNLPPVTGGVAVVQIGSGCLGSCTYCITRLARGRIRSIPEEEILTRISDAVNQGAAEVRLCGQDLSAYGYDLGCASLPSLLRGIASLPGNFRVRLGMMNPATLLPVAGEVAALLQSRQFFAFVHLPVQSGSDAVLSRMGREYTVSEYCSLVRVFRDSVPEITIATDIIAGFPGETEEDFSATCELLREIRPGMVNVTRYSHRPGSMIGREQELPDRIRKDRSRRLIALGYSILADEKQKMTGSLLKVLITEQIREGTMFGRTGTYCGVVIHENLPPGSEYLVEITGQKIHYLTGKVVTRC
jgi:MiaB-like tRNA modifying enzyme